MKLTWYPVDNPSARLEGPCRGQVRGGAPWPEEKYIVVKCTFKQGAYQDSTWNVLRADGFDGSADLKTIADNLAVLAECRIGEMHGLPST